MKNKITLSVIVVLILEVLQLALDFKILGALTTRIVEFLIVAIALVQHRVEVLREIEKEKARCSRLKIEVNIGIKRMFVDLISGWLSDFKKENLTAKENIPSHIFIGMACCFLVFSAIQFQLGAWLFSIFLAIGIGFFIEAVQQKFFGGEPSDRDVRWAINGVPIGYAVWYLLHLIIPKWDWYLSLIFISIFVVMAFLLHKSFKLIK